MPTTVAASLAYGLADRAKLVNPTVSKYVDWIRFAAAEYGLIVMGGRLMQAVGIALLAYKIYSLYSNSFSARTK